MSRPRIAVVGDNTVDRFLDAGIDLIGGNALNTAVHLSMLGMDVTYFGAIGEDEPGQLVLAAARRRGVDVSGVVTADQPTALTTIRTLPNGDRFFESEDFGATADYAPDAAALARITTFDWVHLGMVPHADRLRTDILAAQPAKPISQDCAVSAGYAGLTVAFLSAAVAALPAPEAARQARLAGAALAVVTLGADGVYASTEGQEWRFAATVVAAKDATGAGDAFMAGFIAARLDGADIARALAAGQQRGAYACSFQGGWPQLAADVQAFG